MLRSTHKTLRLTKKSMTKKTMNLLILNRVFLQIRGFNARINLGFSLLVSVNYKTVLATRRI